MSGKSLEVDSIDVAYGSTRVLQDVSLEVAPGEFVALLGSSGSGKTTLLRAISGFVAVGVGRISVEGRDVTHLPPEARGMAMVFQSYALWPHMSVAQNIAYGLKLRRMQRSERQARVAEMLAMLGLEGLEHRGVGQLSGGQRQRVALGRALAVNPPILLLDEPLSNLDARIRQTVRHEIKELQQRLSITAIHVTHDREEAMVMADRIAIMRDGRIVQLGAPEEVYNRPATPFVASFMGADNVVRLDVRRQDGALRIAATADNDETALPLGGSEGAHVTGAGQGPVDAHFRAEAARLVASGESPAAGAGPGPGLLLRGHIAQASYPGGNWRYAVDVGERRFLVDDPRRLEVGRPAGIHLPAQALHLFSIAEATSNADRAVRPASLTGESR